MDEGEQSFSLSFGLCSLRFRIHQLLLKIANIGSLFLFQLLYEHFKLGLESLAFYRSFFNFLFGLGKFLIEGFHLWRQCA